ncbi:hypothetical protein V493_06831 [Pseudogymnoascus sp. VKM F-4281 (FW-2241)]|nr:hypothetical protein V493_06831 [Pseudogymnoascus sp. VKM F-4281 (FW-2241)]
MLIVSNLGDEKSPICGSCNRLGRTCKWGLRASFHPSRVTQLSVSESKNLQEVELGRQHQNALTFVDETEKIEHEYTGPDETSVQHDSSPRAASDSTTEGILPSITEERHTRTSGAENDYHTGPTGGGLLQRGPEAYVNFETLLHPRPPPIPNPPIYTSGNNTSVVNGSFQRERSENLPDNLLEEVVSWPVNDHFKARLLSSYFQDASRWCEMTDSSKSFSTLSSHLIIESPTFAAAAAALASVMVTKGDELSVLLADELYVFARRTLRGLELEHREGRFLATTILCVYCSALGKTAEGQFTLHECAELLQAHSLQNATNTVRTACFWVFVRQDIWASYLAGRPTIIPTESWELGQPDSNVPIQDSYSSLAIWITARIVNELSKQPADINSIKLQNLWAELQLWVIERPLSVRCVMEIESSGDSPFPTILFSNPSAVCGNLYYHTACILLLTTGLLPHQSSPMASPICHARRIAGISITNNDHANLVNNIHPLCVAARQLPGAVEKIAILKHLGEIENRTGWKTKRYILELEKLWGLR